MAEKTDRRQIRTKQLLYATLFELMKEKRAEKITVTDMTNRANINRGTFYLHYRDVADMLEQVKEEMFEKIRSIVIRLDPRLVMESAARNEAHPVPVAIFEEIERNADFFRAIFGPNGDISYAIRFKQFMSEHIFNKLTYLRPEADDLLIPRDYIIAYMSSANLGMLMHWFETGMTKTPQEMGLIMTQLVARGPLVASGMRKGMSDSGS